MFTKINTKIRAKILTKTINLKKLKNPHSKLPIIHHLRILRRIQQRVIDFRIGDKIQYESEYRR